KKQFLVEGFHLVKEAVNSKFTIEQIIIREDVELPEWLNAEKILYVSFAVFDVITQTETPQGIDAIVKRFDFTNEKEEHVLLLDTIQDLGNLGTIFRSPEAAGFTKVVLGKETFDAYNNIVLSSTQASIFY